MVQSASAVRQAIEEGNRQFVESFNRGDIASVAALYAEDAVLLPPNSDIIRGRRGIQAFWTGARQMGVKEAGLETIEVSEAGDMAYEIGRYRLSIEPPGGQPASDEGKYVVVWKRQPDGSWNLAVDIWNTSSPPAQ